MSLCSYIVPYDTGLAPNPFWDYCTLALCPPNYRKIKASKGDWIVGISSKDRGNKLIYAMQVSERMDFEEYFNDARFLKKRPNLEESWKEWCGDNMYFKDENGDWKQLETIYHKDKRKIEQDTRHHFVLIAENFYYFGENAKEIPAEFHDVGISARLKSSYTENFKETFVNWLESEFKQGIHGDPLDRKKQKTC